MGCTGLIPGWRSELPLAFLFVGLACTSARNTSLDGRPAGFSAWTCSSSLPFLSSNRLSLKLLGAAPLRAPALDPALHLVGRQIIGRHVVGVAPGDDGAVRIAFQEVDDHLLADARDVHRPPLGPRRDLGHRTQHDAICHDVNGVSSQRFGRFGGTKATVRRTNLEPPRIRSRLKIPGTGTPCRYRRGYLRRDIAFEGLRSPREQ
jgi:hypothetical protein